MYEACPESKDTKVLNMYNIFNLQNWHWMNCLYITLIFNTVADILQTFITSWNQLLYPRFIEVCRLCPLNHVMTSSCTSSLSSNFFPARCFFRRRNKWKSLGVKSRLYGGWSNISNLNFSRIAVVTCVQWGRALSWSMHTPHDNIPLFCFEQLIEAVSRCHNMQRH